MESVSKKDMLNIFNNSPTTLHATVTIYYGFLKIEIEEITCQLLQGCDLCSSTFLKKSIKMLLGHLSHNLSKAIKEKKLQIMCHF